MTRECRDTTELLSAYLDGEVTEEQARRCDEHLAVCADCRAELERLGAARSLLRAMPEPVVPPSLAGAIKLAVAEEIGEQSSGLLWPAWATPLAAAAALVVAITAGYMLRSSELMPGPELAAEPTPITILEPLETSPSAAEATGVGAVEAEAPAPETVAAAEAAGAAPAPARHIAATVTGTEQPAATATDVEPAPGNPVPPPAYHLATAIVSSEPLEATAIARPRALSDEAAMLAAAPRLTRVSRQPRGPVVARGPSALDRELAGGVIATMLIEDFIEEHLIESTPTLLSVATGTPSADLGPRLVEGEDDAHFELCFTDAMRRALRGGEE